MDQVLARPEVRILDAGIRVGQNTPPNAVPLDPNVARSLERTGLQPNMIPVPMSIGSSPDLPDVARNG